jgi:hypothetical protein
MKKDEKVCGGPCKWRGRDPSKVPPPPPVTPEQIAGIKKMMSDNAWNTGHNPTDGQNPWHFSADGTFKTRKDGHHGTWGIEMRERLYLILIWKSQPKHEWADFVFTENKDKHVKLDWVRGGWSWMKGYQIVNKGWNANVVQNHCTVVKQAHECTADKMCLFEKNACRLMSHEEKIQSEWFAALKGIG